MKENKNNVQMKGSTTMKENKTFAPYNYNALMTAKVGKLTLRQVKGTLIGYEFKFVTIKELCSDALYKEFTLNGYDIHQVFNTVAAKYKAGKIASAQKMYQRVMNALQEYNNLLIKEITPEIKMNKDKYAEYLENKDRQHTQRLRWDELVDALDYQGDSNALKAHFDSMSDKDRELLLMRARDYGLEVPTETMHRRDWYTMRVAPLADEERGVYHKVDNNDPVVTFVGRHKQSVTLRQAENEVMAMAAWFAKYGDEFMMKTYTPDGDEITVREARIKGIDTEEDFVQFRDFQYDASDWD